MSLFFLMVAFWAWAIGCSCGLTIARRRCVAAAIVGVIGEGVCSGAPRRWR